MGKEPSQSSDELAAEDATEHLDRQQEAGTGSDPARVVRREAATGYYAVDMRMWSEGLSPGVQDGEEAQLGAEMLRIGGNLDAARQRLPQTAVKRVAACSATSTAQAHVGR